jgi:hypothetical protein
MVEESLKRVIYRKVQLFSHSLVAPSQLFFFQIHKYVIQGYVQRDSWPLTRKQWDFVENLKNVEEEEG